MTNDSKWTTLKPLYSGSAVPPLPTPDLMTPPQLAPIQSTREGKRMISARLDPATHRAVRQLALDLGISVQQLMERALMMLFQNHTKRLRR